MYSTRNSFYLRISKNTVLPIYLYLDERHVNWMTDATLQHVLSDLRPNILPKLRAEADVSGSSGHKKSTVDTRRGDTYQFCYFIRKTEPHSVLIKTRTFSFAPLQPKKVAALHNKKAAASKGRQIKRKENTQSSQSITTRNKKRRIEQQSQLVNLGTDDVDMADREEDQNVASDEDYLPPVEETNHSEEAKDILDLEIVEEEKPKPILGLTYQGFNIYGQCLCIVVEPWPAARAMPFPLSLRSPRLSSQTTLDTSASTKPSTSKAPLFLPEEPDDLEREPHTRVDRVYLDKVLNTIEMSDDEDDTGGMMEFSQVLHNIGDSRAGAINDDDDMDESMLFGDADEFKEL